MCLSPRNTTRSARRSKFRPILKKSSLDSSTSTSSNEQISYDDKALDNNVPSRKVSASFSTIQIRQYPITLGNNPGGAQGPPITLGWKHDDEKTIFISLDEYEKERPPRRNESELYMPEYLRRWRLLDKGISMKEMQKAASDAEYTRRQRKKTIEESKLTSQYGVKDKIGQLIRGMKSFRYQRVGNRIWESYGSN